VLRVLRKPKVLPDLVKAEDTVDITRPAISSDAFHRGSRLPVALGDALVEHGRKLSDGLAVEPTVFPKEGSRVVPDGHGRGGIE